MEIFSLHWQFPQYSSASLAVQREFKFPKSWEWNDLFLVSAAGSSQLCLSSCRREMRWAAQRFSQEASSWRALPVFFHISRLLLKSKEMAPRRLQRETTHAIKILWTVFLPPALEEGKHLKKKELKKKVKKTAVVLSDPGSVSSSSWNHNWI